MEQTIDFKHYFLLPNKFKVVGWVLLIPGIFLTILRFYFELKPEFLDIKMFTLYSSYFKVKYFTIIDNNYSEEITGLLVFLGLFFIAFTKEKVENQNILLIRLQALLLSLFVNSSFTIIALLFIFGLGFVQYLIINLYLIFIIYIIAFRYYLRKHKNVIHNRKFG